MKRTNAPKLSMAEWQQLLSMCPIKHAGTMGNGDFLACSHVSHTQLSVARFYGGCTVGTRHFIYLPEHDLLVRADFHLWAMNNWRTALGSAARCDAKGERTCR